MSKINKNKGIVFWVTGMPGSGKTSISKKIKKFIEKKFGPTLLINGDDLREIFDIKGYTKNNRFKIAKYYSLYCKFISDQKINLIFTTGSLFHKVHNLNKKILTNYIEILIMSEINILKRKKNKSFYQKKTNNVWGVDISVQFPKKPDIILNNNYKLNINELSKKLISEIKMLNKLKNIK